LANTIIDLKQLKKELAENPPQILKPRPPKPPRKYIRKTKIAAPETYLEIQGEAAVNKKPEIATEFEKTALFSEKAEDEFLLSLSEKGVKETETAFGKDLTPEESFGLTTLMAWQAPEYSQPKNSYERVVLAGIIAAGFFAGALIIKNYLLAVIIFLAYAILYIYSVRKPLIVNFALTSRGFKIGSRLYEFADLKSFWIFYDPPGQKELSIESKKVMMPFIKIPLTDKVNPAELRRQLIKYIPEKKQEESLTDIMARRFGY